MKIVANKKNLHLSVDEVSSVKWSFQRLISIIYRLVKMYRGSWRSTERLKEVNEADFVGT